MAPSSYIYRAGLYLLLVSFGVHIFDCGVGYCRTKFFLAEHTLRQAGKQYGAEARAALLSWSNLINSDTSKTDMARMKKVNLFFNKINFVDDLLHWQKKDYWATPVEFIASGGGDCEDFAIAKYFTLKELGVPESRLNITYVKALKLNQAHMVLTYYTQPGAEPLIIDNLIDEILPASRRLDLLPVYSFNGNGLWLAKQRGRGKKVGSSSRLSLWQNMLQRMPRELQKKEQ